MIYKEAELKIDPEAGGTALCPFDCECCESFVLSSLPWCSALYLWIRPLTLHRLLGHLYTLSRTHITWYHRIA